MIRFVSLLLACCALLQNAGRAATLSVDPLSADLSYTGAISLTISGIPSGESVRVERFLDPDRNGQIEAGEWLVQSFAVTDGQVSRIGGVQNQNVPGDEDGTADGRIQTHFLFAAQSEVNRLAGAYLFRVSSPSNRFAAVLARFEVTAREQLQQVSGRVYVGTAPAAFAAVAVLSGAEEEYVAGTTADAQGDFRLPLVAGQYQLIALKSGSVANFATAPQIELAAGRNAVVSITNLAPNRTISGKIMDSASGAGLPGVMILAEGAGVFNLTTSDGAGNFVLSATAGSGWEIEPSDKGLSLLGYLRPHQELMIDTRFDNAVQNVLIPKANGLIYGTFSVDQTQTRGGVQIGAEDRPESRYQAGGLTDTNGYFTLAVLGGSWELQLEDESQLARGLVVQRAEVDVLTNQAVRFDLTARTATARVRGVIMDDQQQPMGAIDLFAQTTNDWQSRATTDSDGNFDLGVFAADWQVNFYFDSEQQRNLLQMEFTARDGDNLENVRVVLPQNRIEICGLIMDSSNRPVSSAWVGAILVQNNVRFRANDFTDGNGRFAFDVLPGTWEVSLDCANLQQRNLECPAARSVQVTGSQTVNFVLASGAPLSFTTAPDLFVATVGQFYTTTLHTSGGLPPLNWSLVPGSSLPPGLNLFMRDTAVIEGTPTTAGGYKFTIRVQDSASHSAERTFTLTVSAHEPLRIFTTSLPTGQVNVPYSVQLLSGGGLMPHQWVVAPGSAGLPEGLGLSSVGGIQGTPQRAGTFTVALRLIDASGQAVEQSFTLTILPAPDAPLRVLTSTLPPGQVGSAYQARLEPTGGRPPVQWSLSPGSAPLPAGLRLNLDGSIDGTPEAAGTFSFFVRASDSAASHVDALIALTIAVAPSGAQLRLSAAGADAKPKLQLLNAAPGEWEIQVSANLANWGTVANITVSGSSFEWTDNEGFQLFRSRFYRAALAVAIESQLRITSLSASQARPGALLTLQVAGLETNVNLAVRFDNTNRFVVEVPAAQAGPGEVRVQVPPFFDAAKDTYSKGSVSVQVVQRLPTEEDKRSNIIPGFIIDDLPRASVPAGALTLGYLRGSRRELDKLQILIRSSRLDTPAINSGLTRHFAHLDNLVRDVSAVVADPATTFSLGLFDGASIVINSRELSDLDRLILALLTEQAGFGSPVMKASQRGLWMDSHQTEGGAVPQVNEAQNLLAMIRNGQVPTEVDWDHYYQAVRRAVSPEDPDKLLEYSAALTGFANGLMAGALYGGATIPGAQPAAFGVFLVGAGVYFLGFAAANLATPDFLDEIVDFVTGAYRALGSVVSPWISRTSGPAQEIVRDSDGLFQAFETIPSLALPALAIEDITVTEANSGTINASFLVTLSRTNQADVTVDFASANGTAGAGSDYVASSGKLIIPAGVLGKFVTILVNGDTEVEADESFVVNLSAPVNATLAKAQGTGIIRNDDEPRYQLIVGTTFAYDGGSVELDPPGGSYPKGTTVRLLAKPDPGFVLKEWRGGGCTNKELSCSVVIMDSSILVEALFFPIGSVQIDSFSCTPGPVVIRATGRASGPVGSRLTLGFGAGSISKLAGGGWSMETDPFGAPLALIRRANEPETTTWELETVGFTCCGPPYGMWAIVWGPKGWALSDEIRQCP